jgi:hypothetical protein
VDCGVALVDTLPPVNPLPHAEWRGSAVVFETDDPTALLVAESILNSAHVPFLSVNGLSQDLFGIGRLALGFNPILGPMRIEVPREYRKWARKVLSRLEKPASGAVPP